MFGDIAIYKSSIVTENSNQLSREVFTVCTWVTLQDPVTPIEKHASLVLRKVKSKPNSPSAGPCQRFKLV